MRLLLTICILVIAWSPALGKPKKKPKPPPTRQVSPHSSHAPENRLQSIEDIRRYRDELEIQGAGVPGPERSEPDQPNALATVGHDLQKFSEEVASRVDRIVKRNSFRWMGDPWTLQGLPLILPTDSNGFHLGLNGLIRNLGRTDPHKLQTEFTILASDKGRYKHFIKVDAPRAWGSNYRITTLLNYDRDIALKYYGITNNSVVDSNLFKAGYYNFVRAGPTLSLRLLRYLDRYYRVGPVFGLRWLTVSPPTGSLLATENPVGIAGGRTHYLGLAMVRDTTDYEPYPSRGTTSELQFNVYSQLLGSDYQFFRGTYIFRHYITLHQDLIFAHRLLLETLTGTVPFYELDGVGGESATIHFGGDRYLRGYDANRFIDNFRFVYGVELRWDPVTFDFAKQELTIGIVPFFDVGRVWNNLFPLQLLPLHASAGFGLRLIWNGNFIVRGDAALNGEGVNAYVELGHSF
ncbi:MAG: BamA/TamA family outer membrane protein [Deltaproteobacteria bacterium]|nr:BamA/TamA family outer membrane protein [Deltaproteobacteria bacterium]MBI3296438.1 BamA/TamA family outer membrane protein [Deltaproteobacteria bacterium]